MALLFPTSPGPRIKPIEVPGLAKPIDLVRAPDGSAALTVGRGADNDVALDGDSWPSVSTTHARFELRGEELWVVDLDSSNGVLVGGERIDFEARLDVGDQVRLGSVGPRFLVVSGRGLSDTVFVRREAANGGAPEEAVQASEERTRRMVRRTGAAVGVAALAGLAVLAWFQFGASRREGRTQKELESARAQIAALEERQSDRERKERQDRLGRERRIAELERQATELEGTLELQRGEEARLLERIDELESQQASREEVARVEAELARTRADLVEARADLVTTREKVDMFDPVNLAQARLSGVSRVRQSIVLIENETRVHERETGRTMHLDTRGGVPVPNFEGVGDEFVVGSTGSGFCVDGNGHVLTNQHVIDEPRDMPLELFAQDEKFEVRQTLEVVFSGTKRRIPARVVSTSPSGEDLALLVIEPFEGMPALPEFATAATPPPAGSDIYLFGFPLGNLAVQEGETVIASTFRGILSRNVGGQMQVDAGVHPGNSGGPITDAAGRVVGVVVSVQALPDRTAVYTIGYGIPIARAADLWPPEPGD